MMQPIDTLWHNAKNKITNKKLNTGEYHLVRIDESSIIPSYCGIDDSSQLLIGFKTTTRPQIPLIETIAFESVVSLRPDKSWLYVIRLLNDELTEVFESLCIDFISEVFTTSNEIDFAELLRQRVHSWQKLFKITNKGLLNKNQITGLIGELTVLNDLIESNSMPLELAINSWRGPYGAAQDIITGNESIEIKTVRDDITEIKISSLEQLSAQMLSLIIIGYSNTTPDDIDSINISMLINNILSKCNSEKSIIKIFKSALLEAGYSHNESYDNINLKISYKKHYKVCENFPKITHDNIMHGILDATYTISCPSIAKFVTEKYPYGNH